MKNLKTIVLAMILMIGVSGTLATALEVQGSQSSSTTYVYHVYAMTEEELAFAEANCPFSEENLGSSQQSIKVNPLPSDSAIEFNSATDVGCQGSDLPSKGSISTYIKGTRDPTSEYKEAQIYFDLTKTDLFNRKIESLSDSPPSWNWEHSIGDKFYNFDGTKLVEDPGHCWHDPKNCSVLNLPSLFPGFTKNGIW